MGKHLSVEDMKEETVGMVQAYEQEIALASNLRLLVEVEKDEKEKMLKQFEIQIYEQITPNWNAFFHKICYHECIVEKY